MKKRVSSMADENRSSSGGYSHLASMELGNIYSAVCHGTIACKLRKVRERDGWVYRGLFKKMAESNVVREQREER